MMAPPLLVFFTTLRLLAAMLIGIPLLVAFGPPALAAIVHQFSIHQEAPFDVAGTWGVAVDRDLNIYVAETSRHRIVKFSSTGSPIKAWGTEGSGTGQLYYPLAVAAGVNSASGDIRIFVADNGNRRIVTYNENGKVLSAFGSEGSGNNQFLDPTGIAVLPSLAGGTQEICVADARNHRVSCFTEQGQWLKSFDCADCPGGTFVAPGGVFVRRLDGGAIRYYVSDGYPGRVVVLNTSGKHVQTIGGPGQSGELAFPDDLVADKDGNIYVTESGFDRERVMKFDPDGKFVFSFRETPYGQLISPHAIAIDTEGDLYAGQFGSPAVHKYSVTRPRIIARENRIYSADDWVKLKKVFLRARYNGWEQNCNVRVDAAITAEGKPWTIRTSTNKTIGIEVVALALPMTSTQASQLAAALKGGNQVKVAFEFAAQCPADNTTFTSTWGFVLN